MTSTSTSSEYRIEQISSPSLEEALTLAHVQLSAFDPNSAFQQVLELDPYSSPDVRARRIATRIQKYSSAPEEQRNFIGYKAVDAQDNVVGIIYWRKPGYDADALDPAVMSAEEKESYAGYNLEKYNSLLLACQHGQDKVLAERGDTKGCWYLTVLAVHPSVQGKGVGSRLLDHHLARIDSPLSDLAGRPCWLEASPAGKKLYETRDFQVAAMMKAEGWEQVAPEGFMGMYRPAKA